MSAKVSEVKIPTPGAFLGEFHIKRFNLSKDSDLKKYAEIRTKANTAGSGIVIENIRDLKETEETRTAEGDMTRVDTWFIVVSWWENKAAKSKKKGPEPKQGFYMERPVQGGDS